MTPQAHRLSGNRLHLQHGPIDLVIGADENCEVAYRYAHERFQSVLEELVAELPRLRSPVGAPLKGRTACRMARAVEPHTEFITPMAAVAGAVADEVIAAMRMAEPSRAYVNNGGDIAVHVSPGAVYRLAIADHLGQRLGQIEIRHGDGIGGVATSGRHGRSLSMGIADSVTVLARNAAMADAAATLIANAVDLPGHTAILRAPAQELDPDSDLGSRPIVTGVGPLSEAEIAEALDRGCHAAKRMQARGLIVAGALFLAGETRTVGAALPQIRNVEHA